MATVGVEFNALLDPRFRVLGALYGESRFDALGRMTAVWAFCIDKNTNVLTPDFVDALAEIEGFAEKAIQVELAERLSDARLRIKGTEGRIEYLAEARARQKIATAAAAEKRKKEREYKLEPKSAESLPPRDPKSDPISDTILIPSSVSTSTSASVPASALKTEIHIDQRKRRAASMSSPFDLEAAYQRYPRKQGKSDGLRMLAKEIGTDEDYQSLLAAIDRYSESIRDQGTDRNFIMYFSTFASEWRDWVDPATGTVSMPERKALHEVAPV